MSLLSMKKLSQGIKASIAFFFASVISSGITYIVTPIYTRILSTQEYGYVSVYLTWQEIFGILAMFCLSYGVFNNGMMDFPDERDDYSFSMLILSNIITCIFALIVLLTLKWTYKFLKIDIPLLLLMLIYFITLPAYNFWTARQRFEYKYKKVVFVSIIIAITTPIVAILAILLSNNKIYARIFGAEIINIIVSIVFYIYLAYKAKFHIKTKYWKFALKFNSPLILHYLSIYLLSNSDRIMIDNMVGHSETAYYSLAYTIASIVLIIWTAANSSLTPYTYQKCKEEDYEAIEKVSKPIILLFAVACFGISLMAPELLAIISTKEYLDALYVIPPIVGGVFFQVQYSMYATIIYYYKKTIYVMIGSVTATIANIVLNYIFIKKYGYYAAGYTTLVCYFIQALIDYICMKHIAKRQIYDMRYICILSLIVIIFVIILPIIYNYWIIRYCLLLVMIVLTCFKKKYIIDMIQKMIKK